MGHARLDPMTGRYYPAHRKAGIIDLRQYRTRREAEEADDRILAWGREQAAMRELFRNSKPPTAKPEQPPAYEEPHDDF